MIRLVAVQPEALAEVLAGALSEHGRWPGGEPGGVRDAYDRLAAQAAPEPRDAT